MLVTLYKIGEAHFRLLGTNGFRVKAKNERFTAASSRCRQNLKYETFTSLFGSSKGLAKLGNIVAGQIVSCYVSRGLLRKICFGRKICVWEAKMFLTQKQKHFLFSEQQNVFPQHCFLV